jgi:hypothetical protein
MSQHIVFWFLVPNEQTSRLTGGEVLDLLEGNLATPHAPPSHEFEGWTIFTCRLQPPMPEIWTKRYGLDIIGVTGGLEDIFPYVDLIAAIEAKHV